MRHIPNPDTCSALGVGSSTPLTSGRKGPLTWAQLRAKRTRAMVFAPPLIGGSAAHMLRHFRWLGAFGLDVFSFDYAGHGRSLGTFSLTTSLTNAREMTRVASAAAGRRGLPLYGLGVCYGAIPLIFTAAMETPIRRMILLNPIPGVSAKPLLTSFRQWRRSRRGQQRRFSGYLNALFPFTEKGFHGFGALKRRRTRLVRTLLEALNFTPLDTLRLDGTRVLCLYATDDIIRQAAGYACDGEFRDSIRAICPSARFHPIDDDHYLSRPRSRRRIRGLMAEFLGATDSGGCS